MTTLMQSVDMLAFSDIHCVLFKFFIFTQITITNLLALPDNSPCLINLRYFKEEGIYTLLKCTA